MGNVKNYTEVTEIAGDEVSKEQVERICQRYYWAGSYCKGKDVLEAACGTGQGLGYLSEKSKSVVAGDFSEKILEIARKHYGNRFEIKQFDAQAMPFSKNSFDIVILFEAIYYLPSAELFVKECKRVLRKNGLVLIATANKDLYDFNPSPHSHVYYGVPALKDLFEKNGFTTECYGAYPANKASLRQRVLRPIKKLVVTLNLMPKTMAGKRLLKKLVFGKMMPMPAEITKEMCEYIQPVPISADLPDKIHKVIYCVAELK